jgi:alkylation response protein AidB-like acyl-CoA dehydrogenase
MHPAVVYSIGWLPLPEAEEPFAAAWEEQRQAVFKSALDGGWWGTITSEPGSGGDLTRTTATARRGSSEGEYLLSGLKHFGSGSGITSFMVTSAIPEGETEPDWFYLDMGGIPWDGSRGAKLIATWDGHGMIATQSHSFMFEEFPVTRAAWHGSLQKTMKLPVGFVPCLFAAVIVGIVETAIQTAHQQLEKWRGSLRAYEQIEWSRVEMEGWLIQQAYEGMLRAVEDKERASLEVLQGKTAIAELAESALSRICKIVGGGTYNRYSPFGFWYEDVRALGFLRPPWGLAYSALFDLSWPSAK